MKQLVKGQSSMLDLRLKELFKLASFALISLILISSVFLAGLVKAYALSPEAGGDNPLQIVIEPSADIPSTDEKETDASPSEINPGNYPDFGDDQVFPFAAGLDSY
tara:strand:- start:547 stop:864 length:318 start_codon:yes stop_codon:yes gene_type:complete